MLLYMKNFKSLFCFLIGVIIGVMWVCRMYSACVASLDSESKAIVSRCDRLHEKYRDNELLCQYFEEMGCAVELYYSQSNNEMIIKWWNRLSEMEKRQCDISPLPSHD